jgi:hypothetical protein
MPWSAFQALCKALGYNFVVISSEDDEKFVWLNDWCML